MKPWTPTALQHVFPQMSCRRAVWTVQGSGVFDMKSQIALSPSSQTKYEVQPGRNQKKLELRSFTDVPARNPRTQKGPSSAFACKPQIEKPFKANSPDPPLVSEGSRDQAAASRLASSESRADSLGTSCGDCAFCLAGYTHCVHAFVYT